MVAEYDDSELDHRFLYVYSDFLICVLPGFTNFVHKVDSSFDTNIDRYDWDGGRAEDLPTLLNKIMDYEEYDVLDVDESRLVSTTL